MSNNLIAAEVSALTAEAYKARTDYYHAIGVIRGKIIELSKQCTHTIPDGRTAFCGDFPAEFFTCRYCGVSTHKISDGPGFFDDFPFEERS